MSQYGSTDQNLTEGLMDESSDREHFAGRISSQTEHKSHNVPNKLGLHHESTGRESVAEFANPEFYKQENWLYKVFDILFKLERRQTTIRSECWCGALHFVSCLYCLAVIPQQLANAGYDRTTTIVAVAACCGVGSILGGLFSNLPFVLAPPTVVSIFLSVFLQQKGLSAHEGNMAVVISGVILMMFGWRPLAHLASRLIPLSIQVGTAVGIGLLTALAGATEIGLVKKGEYTILEIGPIGAKVIICIAGVILICVANSYKIKGSFALAVVTCSLVWYIDTGSWPTGFVELPSFASNPIDSESYDSHIPTLVNEMVFLYILYLSGLVTSLSDLAHLTRDDGSAPRGRWIYIMSGLFTVMGGLLTSAPILVSPESAAAIKAGAKTGLSAVVCGVLFLISILFAPLLDSVPAAGTSPVLIMIGIILFQNANRIDWRNIQNAAPAFVTLFFIPMTYSIIQGVIIGYIVFIMVAIFTGDMLVFTVDFFEYYIPGVTRGFVNTVHERRRTESVQHQQNQSHLDDLLKTRQMSHDSNKSNTSIMSTNMYAVDSHHSAADIQASRNDPSTGLPLCAPVDPSVEVLPGADYGMDAHADLPVAPVISTRPRGFT